MGADLLSPLRWVYHMWLDHIDEQNRRKSRREMRNRYLQQFRQLHQKNPKTVFLLMTPQHENIGDHAIALAQTNFLKRHGIDYVEITGEQLDHLQSYGILSLMDGKPILMQGGGYLGTLWPQSEVVLREILKAVPRSPVMLLPNTVFYEDTPQGHKFLQESVEVYGNHKNLHICAREKTSYEFMRRLYKNVKLIPDMVFSMTGFDRQNQERKGCILSLRHDQERTRTQEQEQELLRQAKILFADKVTESDMVSQRCIAVEEREQAVREKLQEFAGAELVITDRLHGMVFCAITGTPCIVLNSKSPKVRGCYDWIRDLPYIQFVEDASQIAAVFESIPKGEHRYDNAHLMHYYQELAENINVMFSGR